MSELPFIKKHLKPKLPQFVDNEAHTDEVIEYTGEHADIYRVIDSWRRKPGEIINLNIPDRHMDVRELLNDTLRQTVIVSEISNQESIPDKKVSDMQSLKVVSVNMNAMGGNRSDLFYRLDKIEKDDNLYIKAVEMLENELRLRDFLKSRVGDTAIICMQDFPIYLLRFLGPEFNKLGFSYYANVFGSNGGEDIGSNDGHLASLVTLVNTNMFDGYQVKDSSMSITPHTQGTRRVRDDKEVKYAYGTHDAELKDWEANYGLEHESYETTHNAFQTLNLKFIIEGTDGSRIIEVGNGYFSPPSLMIERSRSIKDSLNNLSKLSSADANAITIFVADSNSYGTDTVGENPPMEALLGGSYYPNAILPAAVRRADIGEDRHINRVVRRAGFETSDDTSATIIKAGGMARLKVDRAAARMGNPDDMKTTVETAPVKTDFTDHHALFVEISSIARDAE
jgi:hypothetical protein